MGKKFAALTLFLLSPLNAALADVIPRVVPDPVTHAAFLYGEYFSNRSNVAVFIDPLCPYCTRAVPKFGGIREHNVFVFWAPIFGERSERALAPIFECEKPSAPEILMSVVARDAFDCDPGCCWVA